MRAGARLSGASARSIGLRGVGNNLLSLPDFVWGQLFEDMR